MIRTQAISCVEDALCIETHIHHFCCNKKQIEYFMKQLFTLLIASLCLSAFAEKRKVPFILDDKGNKILISKDSAWQFAGFVGFSASQAAYYQWVPGNQFALSLNFNAFAYTKYKKGKASWDNNLEAKYGMAALGRYRSVPGKKYPFKKSDDLLQFNSIVGYQIAKGLDMSFILNFKTQFGGGYTYKTDSTGKEYSKTMNSKIFAPAFLKIGPGINYKPVEYFSLFFSPITADFTFVDRSLVRVSNVPIEDRYQRVNEEAFGLQRDSKVLASAGAYLKINFQKDIIKNVNYKTQLEAYYDYTFPSTITDSINVSVVNEKMIDNAALKREARMMVDVDWQNDLIFKVNKFISATLFWRIKYRWRELVPVDEDRDGAQDQAVNGLGEPIFNADGSKILRTRRGVQIAEVLGIGFSYKF